MGGLGMGRGHPMQVDVVGEHRAAAAALDPGFLLGSGGKQAQPEAGGGRVRRCTRTGVVAIFRDPLPPA